MKKSIFLIVLIICLSLKFTALDGKVYWVDEVFTSLRISGYSETEISKNLFNNELFTSNELLKYQYPNSEKSVFDTVKGLVENEPQQAPLYFIILRLWTQLFGNSITVIRSCSAFFSLLTIPAVYWLCRELFESISVSYIAIASISASPFFLLYAQEARSYSLWSLTIILSSAVLLRALRVKTKVSWLIYTLTLITGFYTFLYSVFVAFGHGIYVLIIEKFKFNKNVKFYLLSSTIAVIAFIPWLQILIKNKNSLATYTGWQDGRISFFAIINTLINHVNKLFIDFGINSHNNILSNWLYQGINFLILALVIYSIYFVISQTKSKIYLFILALILPTGLGIIILDFIQDKHSIIAARYFIPSFIGIYLAIAYLINKKLTSNSSSNLKNIWKSVAIFLISLSVLSCINILIAETWTNKTGGYIPSIGRIINQSSEVLVINEGDFWLISLSHYLKEDTKIKIVNNQSHLNNLPQDINNYFVFHSSSELTNFFKQNSKYNIVSLENIDNSILYKIELN